MKFNMTISESTLNTIITALKIEEERAIKEDNKNNLAYIKNALNDIDNNTYVAVR